MAHHISIIIIAFVSAANTKMNFSKYCSAISFLLGLTFSSLGCLAQNSPQDYVAAHNAARAEVGVGPLTWNETVAGYAEQYANTRAADCVLEHSNGPYGENIAEGSGDFSGADAVKLWIDEKPSFDYRSNSCAKGECLHYTQVVWKNSIHLGCARAPCKNGGTTYFVTCNYDPPGNYIGERPY